MKKMTAYVGLIWLLGVVFARADSITQVRPLPLQPLDWSNDAFFDLFNPATGVLNSVAFIFEVQLEGSVGIENEDTDAPNSVTYTFTGDFEVLRPDTSQLVSTQPALSQTSLLSNYDHVTDFAGASGLTFANLSTTASTNLISFNPSDLALFSGVGVIGLRINAVDLSGVIGELGKATPAADINPFASGQLTVVYDFTPVPEPSSAGLLLIGVLAARIWCRRRRPR